MNTREAIEMVVAILDRSVETMDEADAAVLVLDAARRAVDDREALSER